MDVPELHGVCLPVWIPFHSKWTTAFGLLEDVSFDMAVEKAEEYVTGLWERLSPWSQYTAFSDCGHHTAQPSPASQPTLAILLTADNIT